MSLTSYIKQKHKEWILDKLNDTLEIKEAIPNKPWTIEKNKTSIQANPDITLDILKNNPAKPWLGGGLMHHPDIYANLSIKSS